MVKNSIRTGCCSPEIPSLFRKLASIVVLGALVAAAAAQQTATPAASGPQRWLQAGVSATTAYDSNVRQNNSALLGGMEEDLAGRLQLAQQTPTSDWSLVYQPVFDLFPSLSALNSLNQTAAFQATVRPTERWTLNGTASGGYWEQLRPQDYTGPEALTGPEPNALFARTREATGAGQLQLGYTLSPRLTVDAYGGYSVRRFPDAGALASTLSGVRGNQSGAAIQFAATPRTQGGLQLEEQNFSIGSDSHLAAESAVASWTHDWTALTRTVVSAGPEYSHVHALYTFALDAGGLPLTVTDRTDRVRVYPRLAARIEQQNLTFPWSLAVSSEVSNGGGALPFPVRLLEASADLAPRLPRHWRLQLGVQADRFTTLTSGALAGRVQMAVASAALEHPLGPQLSLQIETSLLLQRSQGSLPLTPAVTRGLVGVRLSWQWPPRGVGEDQ